MELRRLGANDRKQMRQMNAVFADAFEDAVTYRYDQPDDAYLDELLRKDNIIILAAFADGAVVAGLVAYVLDKLEQRRSEIYIYDLAVDEKFRRRGIAMGLINKLKEFTPQYGAWAIFVQADRVDEPAVKLYEKMGVREEPLHFDINL